MTGRLLLRPWSAGTRFSLVVEQIRDDGTPRFAGNVALKAGFAPAAEVRQGDLTGHLHALDRGCPA